MCIIISVLELSYFVCCADVCCMILAPHEILAKNIQQLLTIFWLSYYFHFILFIATAEVPAGVV